METQYGKWKVINQEGTNWLCECACGVRKKIYKYNLLSGRSTQCKACATRDVNKRKTPKTPKSIEFMGVTMPIAEWAKKLGYRTKCLSSRLKRFSLEKALSPKRIPTKITHEDITLSVEQWALLLKVSRMALYKRLDRMSSNEVLSEMFYGRKGRQFYLMRLRKTVAAIKNAIAA